jgi:hypothetical protein
MRGEKEGDGDGLKRLKGKRMLILGEKNKKSCLSFLSTRFLVLPTREGLGFSTFVKSLH